MTTVLITGAGGPLGANLTRSLAAAPEPLRLVGTDANRWHLPLSLCERTYLLPHAREKRAYAAALAEIIRTESIDVIVPGHPVEVRAIIELQNHPNTRLQAGVALPSLATIDIADSKFATFARLGERGVPVPRTVLLREPGDVDAVFASMPGRPLWVRGTGAPGLGIGGAALPCRDAGVARAWVEHHQGWGHMAASEYLPGANLTWMAGFSHGTLIAAGARRRLEYILPHLAPSGVTGAPAVSCTMQRDDVAQIGERAVRAIDDCPHGVYFVDMKEDSAGVPRVTEINAGRCGTTVLAYTEAGYNFPWLLVRMARGDAILPLAQPNRAVEPGVYWVRTLDCGPVVIRDAAEFDRYPRAGGAGSEPDGDPGK